MARDGLYRTRKQSRGLKEPWVADTWPLHSTFREQQGELEVLVRENRYHIVATIETWWHEIKDCNLPMEEYKLF